jgi:hypothetical protein
MQCIVTYEQVSVRSYLKLLLTYKFLILGTYHPDTLYLREQGCEDAWLFFEGKRGPREKKFGKQWLTPQEATAVLNLQSAPTNRNIGILPTHATVGSIELELPSYHSTNVSCGVFSQLHK